ncbi:MAG: hypothetical protein IKI11_08865 [Neisseriaceae bacterium]|nr:hypothetical protein [Neisseriaceae bacterium]
MSNHIKSDFYLFSSADGKIAVDVRFDGETVWLSLEQMANLFERDKSTVSRHIKNVFSENELDENSVVANFATTARATVANFATVQNKARATCCLCCYSR